MKSLNIIVIGAISIGLNGCVDGVDRSITQKRENGSVESLLQSNPSKEQDNAIVSSEFSVAEKALEHALVTSDVRTLKLGLKSRFLPIRLRIVNAIAKLNHHTFVPDLVEALAANQIILEGGTETRYEQKELDRAIVSVLGKLTRLEFSFLKDGTPKDIPRIIKRSREWWDANKSLYADSVNFSV